MGAAQQRVLAAQSQGFMYRFEVTVYLGISSKEKIHSIANQRPIELQVPISSEKVIYIKKSLTDHFVVVRTLSAWLPASFKHLQIATSWLFSIASARFWRAVTLYARIAFAASCIL